MIKPKQNKIIHWFFHWYILRIIKNNFNEVVFNKINVDPGKPVLLLANHFGWWDGFLMYYLNHKVLKRHFYIMILEETVRKVWFLKYMGAFSIIKQSRQMFESLNFAKDLLTDPKNLVLIFPQGRLYSNFIDDVIFEKGLNWIIEGNQNLQIAFAATFIENFDHKKPTAYSYLKQYNGSTNVEAIAAAYQQHYNSAKLQQTQIVK